MIDAMTWIQTRPASDSEVARALKDAMAGYPPEYAPVRRSERKLPPAVQNDSIVLAHSLIPDALRHVFSGYRAMLDASLPLSRRQQEMIAVRVSALNDCYY